MCLCICNVGTPKITSNINWLTLNIAPTNLLTILHHSWSIRIILVSVITYNTTKYYLIWGWEMKWWVCWLLANQCQSNPFLLSVGCCGLNGWILIGDGLLLLDKRCSGLLLWWWSLFSATPPRTVFWWWYFQLWQVEFFLLIINYMISANNVMGTLINMFWKILLMLTSLQSWHMS